MDPFVAVLVALGCFLLFLACFGWGQPRIALAIEHWGQPVKGLDEPADLFYARVYQRLKERLGEAFQGRDLDETLPLGRNGIQEFSLMFAWANPGEKAKLAAKLAKAVLA